MPRMKILNAVEQEAFESPPVFNSVQRKAYFDFPLALRHLAASLQAPTHRLGFLLSSAYFKATKKFFAPPDFRRHDIEYVATQLTGVRLCRSILSCAAGPRNARLPPALFTYPTLLLSSYYRPTENPMRS